MLTNDATGCGTVISMNSIGDVRVSTDIFVYIVTLHRLDFLMVARF